MKAEGARERALVLGASVAGLLAARVLAESYGRVTILERDVPPDDAVTRKGVPQGRHAHALLASGHAIMEQLLPGLTQALVERGAPQGWGRFYVGGGFLCRVGDRPHALFVGRPLLETEVRKRVLALANVRLEVGCAVSGLLGSDDHGRVTGARVQRGDQAVAESVPADLVVDATGRGSQAPRWLAELGYEAPSVDRVEVRMGYSSRYYRRRPEHLDGDLIANVAGTRDNTRCCGMMAQEGDRWIVTLAGYFGDYPPTDRDGFLDFARTLPVPDVYQVIRGAEPLTDPVPFRFPADVRHRYEKLARFPGGFLVIGDAIASFTPIYGQGMSVAAMEALALRECLAGGRGPLARSYFRKAARAVDLAWAVTAGGDSSLREDQGGVPVRVRLANWYVSKVQLAARRDPRVADAFLRVANLLAGPWDVLRPAVAWRVLWEAARRSGWGRRRAPGERLRGDNGAWRSPVRHLLRERISGDGGRGER